MTPEEEIKWAYDILSYKVESLAKGKDIPEEVEKGSELVRRAIYTRVDNEWHDAALEHFDTLVHEISKSVLLPEDFRAAKHWDREGPMTLSFYWRWGLWMDCMADVPQMVELLLQGSVGAAFDAARK
jgi:hypothetical protein